MKVSEERKHWNSGEDKEGASGSVEEVDKPTTKDIVKVC